MTRERRGTDIMTWRPVRDVDRVFDEIEETFQDVFGRPFYPVAWSRTPEVRAWSPPMEIYENEQNYMVRMELPGVKKEDIEISATEDRVNIKGERKAPEGMEEGYLLCERCYGEFERSITFPTAINTDSITARFEEGVLNLTVGKVAEAVGRKIEIKSGEPMPERPHTVSATSTAGQPSMTRQSRGTPSREYQPQQDIRESDMSAETDEANRSVNVPVVVPGEHIPGTMPRQRLEEEYTRRTGQDALPGQTGETDEEYQGGSHTAERR